MIGLCRTMPETTWGESLSYLGSHLWMVDMAIARYLYGPMGKEIRPWICRQRASRIPSHRGESRGGDARDSKDTVLPQGNQAVGTARARWGQVPGHTCLLDIWLPVQPGGLVPVVLS
jgi:hypothetical protein